VKHHPLMTNFVIIITSIGYHVKPDLTPSVASHQFAHSWHGHLVLIMEIDVSSRDVMWPALIGLLSVSRLG
jgi:hypothetical protein